MDGEDLAAPITFTPYKSDDHANRVANPEKLRATEIGAAVKSGENLAAVRIPLVSLLFQFSTQYR
jgi:hypothetical protein